MQKSTHFLCCLHRYKEVIVVIGVNPNKKYDVTPAERAELVERMVSLSTSRNNIRVEGNFPFHFLLSEERNSTLPLSSSLIYMICNPNFRQLSQ